MIDIGISALCLVHLGSAPAPRPRAWLTFSWSSSRRRSTPAGPGRLHLVQLLDLAGAGHAGAHLVDVQLVELEACDRRRPARAASPGAAAGSRRRRGGRAPGAHLVDVQLLELEARDRHRPARAGAPGGQLQKLAGAADAPWYTPGRRPAARRKVRVAETKLISSEKTTSSPPQAAQGGD